MLARFLGVVLLAAMADFDGGPAVHASFGQPDTQKDLRVWSEFVSLLKGGTLSESHVRPAYASKETMLRFLGVMREGASWDEWARQPEIHRVGTRLHFVIPLSERGVPNTYSFTFLMEDGRWFLEHFESIVVRLDRVGPPPVSTFPDLPEEKKAWMRQENYWSQIVVLFRRMREVGGSESAFNMLRDGPGYLVQARTWVPFYPPGKAFILYMCWEQSRLHGNPVTLERLTETDAVVTIDAVYLRLYRQSSHMRELLPEADYRAIFETIWRDRATAAGWNIEFDYRPASVTMRFTRKGGSSNQSR